MTAVKDATAETHQPRKTQEFQRHYMSITLSKSNPFLGRNLICNI